MSRQTSSTIKLSIIAIVSIIAIWAIAHTISWVKIEGNEAVVKQDLFKGVLPDVWLSGTKFFCGWTTDVYKYDIGTQKCTFDDPQDNKEAEYVDIEVNCGEGGGQKAWVSMSINYRVGWIRDKNGTPIFSPEKLVKLHKDGIGKTYNEVIIKRTVTEIVNRIARPNEALDIYSGVGFNTFRELVDKELKAHPVFEDRGIYVENTIVYDVNLDPAYEKEIDQKVLAIQQTLRKKEETKAAEEEAKRAFAQAQAQVEIRRQEAEAKKIEQIKDAEAQKAQQVLAAEAEKQKRTLEAEGNRDANLAMASGVLAVGTAEAQVEQLKRDAMYAGEAGARRAQVEIADLTAKRLKDMFNGVSIVPEKTILSTTGAIKGLNVTPGEDQ
jgi:regulator of protease activity HflC (stomatin/prohibitin superfamily)